MIPFLFLGMFLLYGNVVPSAVQTDWVHAESSYYNIRSSIQHGEQEVSLSGMVGLGIGFTTNYQDWENTVSTLRYQTYREGDTTLSISSLGLEWYTLPPLASMRLAFGVDVGLGELESGQLQSSNSFLDSIGIDLHTSYTNYFVFYDYLFTLSLRPTWRFHDFEFSSEGGSSNQKMDASGFVFNASLGWNF